MAIYVHAIPEVAPPRVGVHLLWNGPHAWVYSPRGWWIQRRPWHGRPRWDCLVLDDVQLRTLRERRELRIRFGMLTDRLGPCPSPLVPPPPPRRPGPRLPVVADRADTLAPATARAAIVVPSGCEIITLELDAPASRVRVGVQSQTSFVVGLRDGKVIAGGQQLAGAANHELVADGIDTVVVYARRLTQIGWCVELPRGEEDERSWEQVPILARLQLPIRPLMPLADAAAELAEARSRLLPGEDLEPEAFARLANLLRELVEHADPLRPLDLTLLLHEDAELQPEEMSALDPLRAVLPHPTWRRALGFAWFDRDPSLVPGNVYEYRVSGNWPTADLVDAVYGFHTIPEASPLPSEFYLGGLRVRLPQPGRVERADGPGPIGVPVITRHGVRLTPERQDGWLDFGIDGWSAVLDLPVPARTVELALHGEHALTHAGGFASGPWSTPPAPVPPGERVTLTFPAEIDQLRLGGTGFLCGLRLPPDPPVSGRRTISRVVGPVTLAQTPLPAPPLLAGIANLQSPIPPASSDVPGAAAPPAQALGFEVRWLPAPLPHITTWTPDLPPPPSEATLFQIEHRQVDAPDEAWRPLVDGDNIITGHRDASPPSLEAGPGADLMARFPEVRAPSAGAGALDLTWPDVFDFGEDGDEVPRPPPPPDTVHRYRVRAVDAIGRPSATWTETDKARLEKWLPPPLPVGPDARPAAEASRPEPTGVHARVLVAGAPDLTDAERAVLGSHSNAILLRWGWHDVQRRTDPFAREFRLYVSRHDPTSVAAMVGAVTPLGNGVYDVAMALEREVDADAARGLMFDAGYPFEIVSHGAGTAVTVRLRARVPLAGGAYAVPAGGPNRLPVRLIPEATRAPAWAPRVETVTISARRSYESLPIFDALHLTAAHPRDMIWIGISAADDQPYVPDTIAGGGRVGNESALVAVRVDGRYQGRPALVEAPAIADVPMLVAPEPSPRPMEARFDLTQLLDGTGLIAGQLVRLERVSDAEVVRAYRADGDRVLARVLEPAEPGDAEVEVTVANGGDRSNILAALAAGDVRGLADRYVVFLAASHPRRARLFEPAIAAPVVLPIITDTLPNIGARWVYRARAADAAGRLSADGVTLRGVVRVPATTAVATPARLPRAADDPETRIRFRADGAAEVTHLIVFDRPVTDDAAASAGELVRVPSAPHLALADRVRVRVSDGSFEAGTAIALPPPVDGIREVAVDIATPPGARMQVWACAITRDGVSSPLAGPFPVLAAPLPLPLPTLAVTGSSPDFALSWTWPTSADARDVTVERSRDGARWERISPRLAATVSSFPHTAPPGAWRFRLRTRHLDGRTAASNEVEV